MKLISNRQETSVALQPAPTVSKAIELYGSPSRLAEILQPGATSVCPYTTATMVAAYSTPVIASVITPYMAQAVAILGNDNTDPAIVRTVPLAVAECDDNHVRLLNFGTLLKFFNKLLHGSYKLYGITHAAVMEALQDYCRVAYERQLADERQHRSEEEDRQWEQRQKEAVSWEEYAKMRGIDPEDNPLNKIR